MKTDLPNLSKQEADILHVLYREPFVNQRSLSEATGHSLGVVNRSVRRLTELGLLDADFGLTPAAHALFRERSPRNAVILAAGLGLRMVPIQLTTPKALLEVNGERLIDRIISQLREAGVTDITVVVGFMKDSFEYLIDEYGVDLVYNGQYAAKNNIASLLRVIDRVSNTYIVPCDIWCDRSPFRPHELYSWYMVSDLVDDASDVRVNRKTELVRVSDKAGGNEMLGIAYLAEEQASVVRERIRRFAADPAYDDRFWEDALYTNDRMIVTANVVHAGDAVEINTYEQLRELDEGSGHLRSDALEAAAAALGCGTEDITDIEVAKKGMTNRSFFFTVRGKKYIMRIPGEGTDRLINRQNEAAVYKAIAGRGMCDDPVLLDPESGYKITRFIENARCCDPENENDLRRCMEKLRAFHDLKLTVDHAFDIFEQIDFYESLWDGRPSVYKDHAATTENVKKLRPFIERHSGAWQLTHIDAVPDNFLFDPNDGAAMDLHLIDWEYAGMQDKHVDIAMFAIYSLYDKPGVDRLIDLYFEADGGCGDATRAKIYCYVAACGLLWSNWCEYKMHLGVEFGEYSLREYRYAKDYFRYASELIARVEART